MRSALCAAAIAVASVSACDVDPFVPDFEYEGARWELLPARDGTKLHIVEVYSGVHAQGDSRATKALSEMLHGRRVYPPEGGLMSSDLDGPRQATPDGESPDGWTALENRWRDLSRVLGAGLFLDEAGELCAWRVTELLSIQPVFAGIDAALSAEVLRALGDEGLNSGSFPWFDDTSIALAKERALAGGPWVSWRQGRITLDWPISDASAARALQACSSRDDTRPLAPWFLSQVACFTCGDGRAVLTLGAKEDAAVVFEPPRRDEASSPDAGLILEVRSARIPIGDEATFERSVDELTKRN